MSVCAFPPLGCRVRSSFTASYQILGLLGLNPRDLWFPWPEDTFRVPWDDFFGKEDKMQGVFLSQMFFIDLRRRRSWPCIHYCLIFVLLANQRWAGGGEGLCRHHWWWVNIVSDRFDFLFFGDRARKALPCTGLRSRIRSWLILLSLPILWQS